MVLLSITAIAVILFPLILGIKATEKLDRDFLTGPLSSAFGSVFLVIWSLIRPELNLIASLGAIGINLFLGIFIILKLFFEK